MAEVRISIGGLEDIVVYDDADTYSDGVTLVKAFRILGGGGAGFDNEGGFIRGPVKFDNNVPIQWDTVAGGYATMILLDATDDLIIGNSNASIGADVIRFDVKNSANVLVLDSGGMTILDGKSIVLGTSIGAKIGTATTQKLGFWNATPVIQPASANQVAVTLDVDVTGTDTVDKVAIDANFSSVQTLLNQLRADLVATGIIKGAA